MKYPIVTNVTTENMAGDFFTERRLNAFITRMFICTKNVPSDECLSEAKYIIHHHLSVDDIAKYLYKQFISPGPTSFEDSGVLKLAKEIKDMI